jgi:hypothetical protein
MDDSFYLSASSYSEAEHRSESYHRIAGLAEEKAADNIQLPEILPESPKVVCDYFDPRPVVDRYDAWRNLNRNNGGQRRRFDRVLARMSPDPDFSVIVPVYAPPSTCSTP